MEDVPRLIEHALPLKQLSLNSVHETNVRLRRLRAMTTCPNNVGILGGTGRFHPPSDPLRDIFTADVRSLWRVHAASNEELGFRLRVLDACGPCPSDEMKADEMRFYRAWKAAWDTYIFTAFACGMFEGEKGKDLHGRLRGTDPDGFRSAMAECLTCWFLAGRMRFPLDVFASGRDGKNLDMRLVLPEGDIGIEVKAPFREAPRPKPGENVAVWSGDDADKVTQCLKAANKQFSDDKPNILAIIPRLRIPIFSHRHDLVKAAYGQTKITFKVDTRTGQGGPPELRFFPDGKFLSTRLPNDRPLKKDRLPAYRRISAILCIEERIAERYPFPDPYVLSDEEHQHEIWPIWDKARQMHFHRDNQKWIDHDVLVLHNPHAYRPLPQDMWREFPQFVPMGHEMKWTDGYPIDV